MMTRRRLSVALVVLVLLGTSWADAAAQTTVEEVVATRQLAEQGDAQAQADLGFMYTTGEGVPQDDVEAIRWYRLAADQGQARAHYMLSLPYAAGQGVPQDYVEAHKWRNLAASRASAENQTRYAETRDALATLMTPAQLAEAQTLAREWQAAFDARQ
jgi:TPR repeat protein